MPHLSRQQIRIAMWLDSPYTHRQIAARLHIGWPTYQTANQFLYAKLGVDNRIDAITAWNQLGSSIHQQPTKLATSEDTP